MTTNKWSAPHPDADLALEAALDAANARLSDLRSGFTISSLELQRHEPGEGDEPHRTWALHEIERVARRVEESGACHFVKRCQRVRSGGGWVEVCQMVRVCA